MNAGRDVTDRSDEVVEDDVRDTASASRARVLSRLTWAAGLLTVPYIVAYHYGYVRGYRAYAEDLDKAEKRQRRTYRYFQRGESA